MFKLLYHKFIRDNVYQVLSESTGFCGRYDNKHFGVFFPVHSVQTSPMTQKLHVEIAADVLHHPLCSTLLTLLLYILLYIIIITILLYIINT